MYETCSWAQSTRTKYQLLVFEIDKDVTEQRHPQTLAFNTVLYWLLTWYCIALLQCNAMYHFITLPLLQIGQASKRIFTFSSIFPLSICKEYGVSGGGGSHWWQPCVGQGNADAFVTICTIIYHSPVEMF